MADSTQLYNTFGNELRYRITQQTLEAYLNNATIKFPLPEASTTILGELADASAIDPTELEVIQSRLVSIGFGEANARAMSAVLIQVAKAQNVSPLEFFSSNKSALKLAVDSYETINLLRPPGNRISVILPKNNKKTKYRNIIRP